MWTTIQPAPADAILGLTEAFRNDPNPDKVNLGAGVYKNDAGTTPILACVKDAERILLGREHSKSYLPISGDPEYTAAVKSLVFGPDSEVITSGRAATVHAPGGTGALRIGAELLKTFRPEATVWLSSPTWANHKGIFSAAGFALRDYAYYDSESKGLMFEAMLDDLKGVAPGDIVILHACCHNPSGVDLSDVQWSEVATLAQERGWLPFLDFAYQGFGSSVDEDRVAVASMAQTGTDFFVASSFSKNFGLYSERTGALTVVSSGAEAAEVAMSHLKSTIRVCYSNPPAHGSLVAKTVLLEPQLEKSWREELAEMCQRIIGMRAALVDGIARRGIDQDFSYIKNQRGMFSFSGLSDAEVAWLRQEKSIYVVGGGRINVAGLTSNNIDYVCDSIAEVLGR